jgi:hypothetical protein
VERRGDPENGRLHEAMHRSFPAGPTGRRPAEAWENRTDEANTMPEIRPLIPDDLPELSRFLTAGFHAPPEADFAAAEVLRWKYLGPATARGDTSAGYPATRRDPAPAQGNDDGVGSDAPRSYVALDEAGRIVGHLGLCRTAFEGQALAGAGGPVGTIHIIDWLGSPEHRAIGMSLMRLAHRGVATQFGLGVSQAALVVGERAGYELRSLVPVYTRVLRSGYWLRAGGLSPLQRGLRLVRDFASGWVRRPAAPRAIITLRRVSSFGSEINPIVDNAKAHMILTRRDPARLNDVLHFPRQSMSGWHLVDSAGRLRGFALLNLVPRDQGRTRTGKFVDCLLDEIDVAPWQAAVLALTRELARQGADLAQAYASTPWTTEALSRSGYTSRFTVKFHIRDRQGIIPRDTTFYLTPLEGDYAYT